MKIKGIKRILLILSGMIICGLFLMMILGVIDLKMFEPDNLVKLLPEDLLVAFIIMMLLFVFKSLSVMFPISVLYIVDGVIFPRYIAIIVSLLGLFISQLIPYLIGKLCDKDKINNWLNKYPIINKVNRFHDHNSFITCFLTRIIGIPETVASIYFGMIHTKYFNYALGSILGSFIRLLLETTLGTLIS